MDSFAVNRGMIELAKKSNKTQLIINLTAVRTAGIRLNSNLIDLAQVVGDEKKTGGSE
ncbi:YfiR/HmsC family protein [Colwellia piezophila]|uniref:YfiR/HmsC family protein n=1 Tax=Colwellia piezophila TaxID=211668 RepID=UPI003CCBFB40